MNHSGASFLVLKQCQLSFCSCSACSSKTDYVPIMVPIIETVQLLYISESVIHVVLDDIGSVGTGMKLTCN